MEYNTIIPPCTALSQSLFKSIGTIRRKLDTINMLVPSDFVCRPTVVHAVSVDDTFKRIKLVDNHIDKLIIWNEMQNLCHGIAS